ncbi:hypothetical protein DCM78_05565 [Bradyrhizobium sp. WBOS04]|nr:hypothetical protein [Bradyrhizobium sp. WBOS8]UUO46448.1 hypothetical protein DCM78_05565 [Bradyrhizobium sp. WBOS04]
MPLAMMASALSLNSRCRHSGGALPPSLAGEGGGEGVSTTENPQEEGALTRRFAPTSPTSGRGEGARNC